MHGESLRDSISLLSIQKLQDPKIYSEHSSDGLDDQSTIIREKVLANLEQVGSPINKFDSRYFNVWLLIEFMAQIECQDQQYSL